MIQNRRKIIVAVVCVLVIILSLVLFVGFGFNSGEQEVIIKSVTPEYDENSTIKNNVNKLNHSVTFNDKNQNIKYYVVLENTADYDVKVADIELDTPEVNFLKYEIKNLAKDDVLKSGKTKEIVVSIDTFKTEGWGRNFEDELITNLKFEKFVKNDSDSKKEENVDKKPVTPPVSSEDEKNDLEDNVDFDGTHSIETEIEDETNCPKCEENKKGNCFSWKLYALIVTIVAIILALILIFMFKKYKLAACIILFVLLCSFIPTMKADTLILLPLKFNVFFESQNVMKPTGCRDDNYYGTGLVECVGYWNYNQNISNINFMSEIVEPSNFDYKFDMSVNDNGKVIAYLVKNDTQNICYDNFDLEIQCYDLYIQADGIIYANSDARYYFGYMKNLENIVNFNFFDTSNVTNMQAMFYYTGYNNSKFTLDVSNFDTSNVTDMGGMFSYTGYNSGEFTLDVSNFDTSKVTNMTSMFNSTGYNNTNFTLDVSKFDTSKVTSMVSMFNNTGYKSTNFTLDVSNFDTSNVTNMSSMFYNTGYNSTNFTLDVSNFDTSKVTNMASMFNSTGYKSTNFTLDVSNFDTSKVTSMVSMFNNTGYNSTNFTLDVSNFDTSNVTNMSSMFYNTGYNSTKFNTLFTIRNAITSSSYYSKMFTGAATKEGSQITVNYTSANSSYIDNCIATKSVNSNVVKGVRVD